MKNIYTLTYRTGNNPHPLFINFEFSGNLNQAIARARTFCDRVSYRFHGVRPFISDLDSQEARHDGLDITYPAQPRDLENPNPLPIPSSTGNKSLPPPK